VSWWSRGRRPPFHPHPTPRPTCAVEDFDDVGQAPQQGQDNGFVVVPARRGLVRHFDRQTRTDVVNREYDRRRTLGSLAPTDRTGAGLADRQPQFVQPVLVQMGPASHRDRHQPSRSNMPGRGREPQFDPEHRPAGLCPGYARPPGSPSGTAADEPPATGCPGSAASASPNEGWIGKTLVSPVIRKTLRIFS
jgi:hypothetical protein